MYVLQVNYLKVYQSLTNFYLNITSFSKNIKFVTTTLQEAPRKSPGSPVSVVTQLVVLETHSASLQVAIEC
jgi:hypothetical protein